MTVHRLINVLLLVALVTVFLDICFWRYTQ